MTNSNVVNEIRDIHQTIKNMESQMINLAEPVEIDIWEMEQHLRRARDEHFPAGYFSDVAWEILLELARAENSGHQITITDVGLNAGLPLTTTLRYLTLLVEDGFVSRMPHTVDRRRVILKLTSDGRARMAKILGNVHEKFHPVRFEGFAANDVD